MYLDLCRELTKQGWSLSDIENNSFDTLIEIACVSPKKEKQEEVDLKDFANPFRKGGKLVANGNH